jgi:hypothetical protein
MNKYIVWVRNGCDGWSPTEYITLEEAIHHESYGSEKIITKEVRYEIKEIE